MILLHVSMLHVYFWFKSYLYGILSQQSSLGWESWTDSLTMVLDSHGDKLDQTGVKDQTELNYGGDKLELLVDFLYEQF